ncbi:MAG: flavocytochrome c, partial [Duodenibacillus sp.]|nr:flavocytochrome c [Duodenibacillus sp.]
SAAITARQAGASVVVLEKMAYIGGNTNFSSGGMNAPGTRQQRELGITDDSPDIFFMDTMRGGKYKNNPQLLHVLSVKAAEAEEWLLSLGARFCARKGRGGGQSKPRSHGPCDGSAVGIELLRVLKGAADKEGVAIRTESQVTEIVMKDGRAAGVKVKGEQGEQVIDAKAVVLATGGFAANHALVERFRPELKGFSTTNHPGAQGEGLLLAEKVGAAFTDIGEIQIHPTVSVKNGHLISESMRARGGFLVNLDGNRFVNELRTRAEVSQETLKQKEGKAYLLYDSSIFKSNKLSRGYYENGYSVKGDDVEQLAAAIGVPPANLRKAFEQYWAAYDAKKDEAFGRPEMLIRMDQAPFYAAKVTPGLHHTMGGVTINTRAEVQDKEGRSIPALFAAGEVTGGVHGGNRIGGNAVADIVTFGRIAGANAAKAAGK